MKLKFDLKQLGSEAGRGGAAIAGFSLGHLAFNKVVPQTFRTGLKAVIVCLAMFAVGAFIATQTENKLAKAAAQGFEAYSGVKLLNSLTGITPAVSGVDGFGFAIPEGISNVFKQIVPNLGEAEDYDTSKLQIFGPGVNIPAEDANYQILAAADDLILPQISGNGEYDIYGLDAAFRRKGSPQSPIANKGKKFTCVSVEGLGEVEILAA